MITNYKIENSNIKSEQIYIKKGNKKLRNLASKYSQQDAGFSLLELVVVVLIIAILATIAAPGWAGFVNRQRLNKANEAVLAALQEAQREAKRTKFDYSVSLKFEDKIPKIAVHPSASSPLWKTLGENLEVKPGQIALLTNLTDTNKTDEKGSLNLNYNFLEADKTITFDYLGSLSGANFGGDKDSEDAPGLKIAVVIPKTGNAASANDMKRCVIVKTLLGTMITEKDNQCN